MTEINNVGEGRDGSGMGMGVIVGIVIVIAVIFLVIMFRSGDRATNNSGGTGDTNTAPGNDFAIPDEVDVNVNTGGGQDAP